MSDKKEAIKDTLSRAGKKTSDVFEKSGRWIKSLSKTVASITETYVDLKLKQSKLKSKYNNLGKEAYRQWNQEKKLDLKHNLAQIEELHNNIQSENNKLHKLSTHFGELFSAESKQTVSPVKTEKPAEQKKKKQSEEKPKTQRRRVRKPAASSTKTASVSKTQLEKEDAESSAEKKKTARAQKTKSTSATSSTVRRGRPPKSATTKKSTSPSNKSRTKKADESEPKPSENKNMTVNNAVYPEDRKQPDDVPSPISESIQHVAPPEEFSNDTQMPQTDQDK